MGVSTNRITGLATGLDIDSIVKSSMQGYQNKIDKAYKQKTIAEIRQQLYQDIIKDGKNFYTDYLDLTKSSNIISSSAYNSVGFLPSDESVATAVGGADALKNNYEISVTKKAAAANLKTTTDGLGITKDAAGKYVLDAGKSIQITSGTEASTVIISAEQLNAAGVKTERDLSKFINNKISGAGYKCYTSDFEAGKIVFEAADTGKGKVFHVSTGAVDPEHLDGAVAGPLTLSSAMEKNGDGTYKDRDIQIDFGGKELILQDETIRSYIQDHNDSNDTINSLTLDKVNSGTLNADDKKALNEIQSALVSHRTELVKNPTGHESEISDCNDKITKLSQIVSKFDSDTTSVTLSEDDKVLLRGTTSDGSSSDNLLQNSLQYTKEKLQSDLTEAVKGTFGTDDTEAKNPKVVASIDASGSILFKDSSTGSDISYQVGKRIYAQVTGVTPLDATDGNGLEATVKNTATNEIITYKDDPASGNPNEKSSSSNNILVDGAAITINNIGDTSLTAKSDVTELKDKIVKFVNGYNTYVTKLNTLLTEKKYRDYEPLTDEQKKDMKDAEITAWNEKVKSGQLKDDGDLQRIRDNMVDSMTNLVSGAGITLNDMGISLVESYGTTTSGTYSIDEEKLTAALQNKTEEVSKLFTDKGDNPNNTGIAYRLKDIFESEFVYSSKSLLIQKAGYEGTKYQTSSTLSTQITSYKDKIDDLKETFSERQQALYSKWANIETIMNNYNSQSSYLSSMFSSGS